MGLWLFTMFIIMEFACTKIHELGYEAVVECPDVNFDNVKCIEFYKSEEEYTCIYKVFKKNNYYSHHSTVEGKRNYKLLVYKPNKIQLLIKRINQLDLNKLSCVITMDDGSKITQFQVLGQVNLY